MKKSVLKLIPQLTIIVVSIVVALIFAELILRVIKFQFALYPTEIQFGWPDPESIKKKYQADEELLWVPKNYYTKIKQAQQHKPKLVFMGDSCTEFGRYDSALDEIINENHENNNFEFANVGTGGWTSYQGINQFKRDVLPIKPQVVTFYYGWNDHWESFGIEDKNIGEHNLEHPDVLLLLSKLRVVQLINNAIFNLKYSDELKSKKLPLRVSLKDYESNLVEFVTTAKNNGIIPILITAPTSHKKGEEPEYLAERWLSDVTQLIPLHNAYINTVKKVATSHDALLFDLHHEFDQMSEKEIELFFMEDGVHLTEEGNYKIAELMYQFLRQNDLLDKLDVNNI